VWVLIDEANVVVAGSESRRAGRRNPTLADLIGEPWVLAQLDAGRDKRSHPHGPARLLWGSEMQTSASVESLHRRQSKPRFGLAACQRSRRIEADDVKQPVSVRITAQLTYSGFDDIACCDRHVRPDEEQKQNSTTESESRIRRCLRIT
jgi:hypothetical protein